MKKAVKSHQAIAAKPPKKGGGTKPFFQKKESPTSGAKPDAFFQPKLKVNKPNDKFEKEADHVADQVTSGQPLVNKGVFKQISPLIQRQSENDEDSVQAKEQSNEEEIQTKSQNVEEKIQAKSKKNEREEVQLKEEKEEVQLKTEEEPVQTKKEEEEPDVQMKPKEDEEVQMKEEEGEESLQTKKEREEDSVQRRKSKTKNVNPSEGFISKLNAKKGKGNSLPEDVRIKMENAFSANFGNIQIHTDQTSIDLNKKINAQAFTTGKDIFFNAGKFKPESKEGLHLLAHELTHTIQQGVVSPKQQEAPTYSRAAQESNLSSSTDSLTSPNEPSQSDIVKVDSDNIDITSAEVISDSPTPTIEGKVASIEEIVETVPASPEEDPNFIALTERTKATAKGQKKHKPSSSLSKNASDAAPSATNETKGIAQANQVTAMEKKEPKKFDAASFKKLLLEKIKEILPKSEEEADNFSKNNKMDAVKDAASNKVAEEKQTASGGIPEATNQNLDTASVPKREIAELKTPKKGANPANLEASKAMPPKRPDSHINKPLEENAKEADDAMAQNNVTEDQLARSEEPTFITGLESKKTAQNHSKTAPQSFREKESGVIQTSKDQSDAKSQEQVQSMHAGRGKLFGKTAEKQKETSSGNTSKREQVAKAIDGIYEKAKTDVNKVLTDLDTWVEAKFDAANKAAKEKFEKYVEWKMDQYKEDRYGSWFDPRGWGKRLKDTVVGMPDEVNQFFVDGRELYLKLMDRELTIIAKHIATELNRAKDIITKGKQSVQDFVDKQPADLKKFAEEKANEIQDSFNQLESDVDDKQEELIETIAESYKASLEEVDARVDEMKAANRGLIDKAMDAINGIIETIKKLRQVINDLMSAIQSVIPIIMNDPIGFMKNLFEGIGMGIENFKTNIKKHLLGGLFKWLTGALGPMGITVPEDVFSLKGIFNLIVQVLGLGWGFIRKKLVFAVGEKGVKFLEKGFEVIKLINEKGIDGIWEFVKQKFQDIKKNVLDAIQDMIIVEVIKAGVKWLLSLLIPGAGFIKAIMAIKDVIVFFVESAIMLIPAITEAILALATGAKNRVAKAIEFGLGTLVPLIIDLLARLIGIKGLAKKVQKIIKNIRKRISDQVNKLIRKAKNWLKKMFRKGKAGVKKGVKKVKKGAKKVKDKIVAWWKAKKKFRGKDGKNHKLYFKGTEKNAKLMVASEPKTFVAFIDSIKAKPELEEKKRKAMKIAQKIDAIKTRKTGGAKEADVKKAKKKKQRDLQKQLDLLGPITANLFGVEGDIPKSKIAYSPKSGKLGGEMNAKILTKVGDPGSVPSYSNNIYKALFKRAEGGRTYYVRGHLLNHNIHGPGNKADNLTPLSQEGNKKHLQLGEETVKIAVTAGSIVNYMVSAKYNRGNLSTSNAALKKAGVDESKWDAIKEIRSMEGSVPTHLILKADLLVPNSSGKLSVKKVLVTKKKVPNKIDTNLANYEIFSGDRSPKKRVSITNDSIDKIVENTSSVNKKSIAILQYAALKIPNLSKWDQITDKVKVLVNSGELDLAKKGLTIKNIEIAKDKLKNNSRNVVLNK